MKWTEEHRRNHKAAFASRKGEKHWNWKGSKAGYKSLHEWIAANWGRPNICEKCGLKEFTEWASKEGNYTRQRIDWLALCRSCHRKYDGVINNLKGI